MLCPLKCSDICDCMTICVTLQVTAEQKHRNTSTESPWDLQQVTPTFLTLAEYSTVSPSCSTLAHTTISRQYFISWPQLLHHLPLFKGKYFTQGSDIATSNQTCKRKRMPDKCLPQLCRKQILTNKHKVSVMITRITWTWSEVLFANLLLYSFPF